MTSSPSQTTYPQSASSLAEDEIDLSQVAGALYRHRRLISIITGTTLVMSGIYAFTRQPVWKGSSRSSSRIKNLLKLEVYPNLYQTINCSPTLLLSSGGSSQLQTEVKATKAHLYSNPHTTLLRLKKPSQA